MDDKESATVLSEREQKIIDIIRGTEYGELKIIVQNGEPVRVEAVTKSIKL